MKLQNGTPFSVIWMPGRMQYPAHSLTIIVKGTFDLRAGEPAVNADKQLPITPDLPHPDDEKSGPYYDSDFAYFKPRADRLLVGRCYAPGGRPVTETTVAFSVGSWSRRLRVIGDRQWKKGVLKTGASDPRPFTEMDLRWSRAYGGPRFAPNLAGRGYHRGNPEGDIELALPNIEDPSLPIRSPSDPIAPAGFCPLDRTWAPRKQMIGTYGKKWFRTRCPWVPEDIDWTVSNAAPALNQSTGYLQGDEVIGLENLNRSSPRFSGRLPGIRVRALIERHGLGGFAIEEVPLQLDTLWVDADALQAVLVWRGVCTVASEEFEDLQTLLVASEPLGTHAPARELWSSRVLAPPTLEASDPFVAHTPATEGAPDESHAEPAQDEPEPELTPEQAAALAKLPSREEMLATFRRRLAELPEGGIPDPNVFDERAVLLAAIELLEPRSNESEVVVPWTRERVLEAVGSESSLDRAELAGCDLTAIDFRQVSLRGADLRGSRLQQANFSGCDLTQAQCEECDATGASFEGADLGGARLQRATLNKAKFSGARLAGADLRGALLDDALLDGVFGRDVDLRSTHLDRTVFEGADLERANFAHAAGIQAHFEHARLDDSEFVEATLRECFWQHASCAKMRASKADFSFSDISDASFTEADLSQALLRAVRGDRASFVRADLAGANVTESDLDDTNFTRASLVNTDLTAASLRHAILRRARLERTVLAKANLFEALLPAAQLLETDFRGASLFGADLADIEGRGVKLEGANVKRTRLDPE